MSSCGGVGRATAVIGLAAALFTAPSGSMAKTSRGLVPEVARESHDQERPSRIDYLTFARGAVPLSIGGTGVALGPNAEHQVRIIDGDPTSFGFMNTEDPNVVTDFVYQLPATTIFDRFAVPSVVEVPSAYETFTRSVEVWGSSTGPDGDYVRLASAVLETHTSRDQVTELEIHETSPVRWIRLRLSGGIDIGAERMGFDFSELIGNGTQQPTDLVDHFSGAWDSRFVKMELTQEGPLVAGCYDSQAVLEGTVDGNILRARGVDQGGAQTVSLFVLSVLPDGRLIGVRSTNGGPFRLYEGGAVEDVPRLDCDVPPPALGCGSVIHALRFDFDSAELRPESDQLLARLHAGLDADPASAIVIVGHTSSEGDEDYNLGLSRRRAESVVQDLVRRGLDAARIGHRGLGESDPIASNDDEAGRALNRRVAIECG